MLHSLFIGRGDAIDYKNHWPTWAVNVLRKQLNFKLFQVIFAVNTKYKKLKLFLAAKHIQDTLPKRAKFR